MEGKRCKISSIQYTTVVGVKSTAYLHFPEAIGTRNIYIWGIITHSAHLCPTFRWRVLIAMSATNDVFTSLQHSFASYCQAEPNILSNYFLSVSSSAKFYILRWQRCHLLHRKIVSSSPTLDAPKFTLAVLLQNCSFVFREILQGIVLLSQFYIQLVYKPEFRTLICLFGPFGQIRAVRKKVDWSFSEQLLRV